MDLISFRKQDNLKVSAALNSSGDKLIVDFKLSGNLNVIRWPMMNLSRTSEWTEVRAASLPSDELWRRTCFEVFVGVKGSSKYFEWNFSPLGEWANYAFSDYRIRDGLYAPVKPQGLFVRGDQLKVYEFRAAVSLSQGSVDSLEILPALVIELESGEIEYFATAHPHSDRADFHDRRAFRLFPGV